MNSLKQYCFCLLDQELMPTAVKVATVVGTLLFIINHGSAVIKGEMNRDRWISAGFTYIVPYCVNIHGQYISRMRRRKSL
ncbi:nitrate/nitrite transporter NrtS [Phormidium sp. LEGE 05292]|uniref:nitrate/nitrite transporter NrtS n=1 Tax=[Phormidium] sp. LEGE 05292 TaxID=767427 RepID=UPI00187DE8A4|nr:nitrate/nitrite transporter NrtS [Phormidium sp. LEGE 05292]MBE9225917.1 nitrate/nitrite transporter NrtS [Phormidium sp. LEGE 05292]